MNRRTFIKLTGVTAVAVTTPLMAFAPEPQWIDFVDQIPLDASGKYRHVTSHVGKINSS